MFLGCFGVHGHLSRAVFRVRGAVAKQTEKLPVKVRFVPLCGDNCIYTIHKGECVSNNVAHLLACD